MHKDKKAVIKSAINKNGKGGPGMFPSLNSLAQGASDTVGAGPLTDYLGSKIAKLKAPKETKKFVEDNTSWKDAVRSAGSLALSVAPAGVSLGVMRGARAAAEAGRTASKLARAKSAITGAGKDVIRTKRRIDPEAAARAKSAITGPR